VEEDEGVERNGLAVLGAKGDASRVERDESVIGDADAMRVATEIADDLLGSAEGSLGVGDPWLAEEGGAEALPGLGIAGRRRVGEGEAGRPMSDGRGGEELAAEEGGQNADGQEVALACRHPALLGPRPSAAGDDAM